MEEENKIDHLFKQGLSDPEIPFNEMDWEKMEQKLDAAEKKRRVPLWIFSTAGIAAALLVVLFWFLMKPVENTLIQLEDKPIAKTTKPKADSSVVVPKIEKVISEPVIAENRPVFSHKSHEIFIPSSIAPIVEKDSVNVGLKTGEKDNLIANVVKVPDSVIAVQKTEELAQVIESPASEKPVSTFTHKKPEVISIPKPGLVLSVMAAPDLSTTSASKPSKLSSNFGLLVTYSLTNKLSITSGAVYSRKFYNAGGVNGKWNTYTVGKTWEVDADCEVLDIPVNVNYKIFNKRKFSVSLNSGLSSYFMLTENYKFFRNVNGVTEPISSLQLNNQNRHLFGVANISLNFERQITKGVSVGVQPFIKIPLTGIGYGNANLKSTGMSFSLNFGLFR